MPSSFIPLKIYLKGKERPIEIEVTKDMIMYLTDFINDNLEKNVFTMEYVNHKIKRFLVIQRSQLQALDFDDFELYGGDK